MFTGIIEEIGQVAGLSKNTLTVKANKVVRGIELGASIAVNGVCLTATSFDAGSFTASIMEETLKRTNLGKLKPGDAVNLEGALTLSKGMGGHLVQGHIDTTGQVKSITHLTESMLITITAESGIMNYIVEKGFVAVNGASLTVVERGDTSFVVSIVDFTKENTNLAKIKIGDIVNLEADIIAKYVEQFITMKKTGISMDFLQEHGFLTD
jgi:riboflavin synthase